MQQFGEFGYGQGLEAINKVGQQLGITDASTIVATRDEMFSYIDNFVKYRLEMLYVPILGEAFNLLITDPDIRTDFIPIESMKTTLWGNVDRETAERHMIVFLHELKTTLAAEVQSYKDTVPRYLLDNQVQNYANGEPLLSVAEETTFLRANPARTMTYATGPVGSYFQDFVRRVYGRAATMVNLAARYDGRSFEYLPVEVFRRMAQVINKEKPGLSFKGLLETDTSTLTITPPRHSGRSETLGSELNEIFVGYEDAKVTKVADSSSTEKTDALEVINHGRTAFIATVGTGASAVRVAIERARKSGDTITPRTTRFKRDQVGKGITFVEMPAPTVTTPDPFELYVNDFTTVDPHDIFRHEFIRNYGLSNQGTGVSTNMDRETKIVTITANSSGNHSFVIFAISPTGRTEATIEVIVDEP